MKLLNKWTKNLIFIACIFSILALVGLYINIIPSGNEKVLYCLNPFFPYEEAGVPHIPELAGISMTLFVLSMLVLIISFGTSIVVKSKLIKNEKIYELVSFICTVTLMFFNLLIAILSFSSLAIAGISDRGPLGEGPILLGVFHLISLVLLGLSIFGKYSLKNYDIIKSWFVVKFQKNEK